MIVEARIAVPASWGVRRGPLEAGGEVTFSPTGIVGRILKGIVEERGPESEIILTLEIDDEWAGVDHLRRIATADGPLFP